MVIKKTNAVLEGMPLEATDSGKDWKVKAQLKLEVASRVKHMKIGIGEVALLHETTPNVIYTGLSDRRLGRKNARGPYVRQPFKEGRRSKWWYLDIVEDLRKGRRT